MPTITKSETNDVDHLMTCNRKKGVFHNNQLLLGHKQQQRKKAAHQPGASSSNHAGAGSTGK